MSWGAELRLLFPSLPSSRTWLPTSGPVIRIQLGVLGVAFPSKAGWLHAALLAVVGTRVIFCFYDSGITEEVALSSLMELLTRDKTLKVEKKVPPLCKPSFSAA